MRLATIRTKTGPHVGVVIGDDVADLTAADARYQDAVSLLCGDDRAPRSAAMRRAPRIPLAEASLAAPIPRPGKFLAIGLNARDHLRDISVRWLLREPHLLRVAAGYLLAHPRPKYPFFFAKATSSITGPRDPIHLPVNARMVDWEGELAVVIGAPARHVDVAGARAAIGGYLLANDITVRDWQTDNPTSTMLAKGYDTHGPLGPWLVTPDEIDPAALELRTWLNGNLVQHGRIADLTHSPAEIVSIVSQFCTLLPGDVIACGTFAGTGWPRGRFLRHGDTVRVHVESIGELNNPVLADARRPTPAPTTP